MDRNLGASEVATSSTDAAAYGDLYQWGRGTDGHQIRTSGTTTNLSGTDVPGHGNFIKNEYNGPFDWRSPQNDLLWQGLSGINNPCPSGYRIPNDTEWAAEMASWGSLHKNAAGAYVSPLKLPVAGNRGKDGVLGVVGDVGYYWTSTVSGDRSLAFGFDSGSVDLVIEVRGNGFSVRCIKD